MKVFKYCSNQIVMSFAFSLLIFLVEITKEHNNMHDFWDRAVLRDSLNDPK